MRSFALRTTTNPFKTRSAWVPGSGLVQIAVSSMLRLDCPPSTQLYLRSTVDTALQICTTDFRFGRSRWRDGRYRVLAGRLFSELQDLRS